LNCSYLNYFKVKEREEGCGRMFFFFLVAPTLGSLLPLLEHKAGFPEFLDQGQFLGLLGRVISSSQGLYLYTNTEKHTHTYTNTKHPCPE
jgi:hypothetical protein